MKKINAFFLLILMIFISSIAFSQDNNNNNRSQKDKEPKEIKEPYFFWGGYLWFAFGSFDMVDINLILGNQLTERLSVGISGKYQYSNDKRFSYVSNSSFRTHSYGGSAFLQFAVVKDFREIIPGRMQSGLIAHAEYELLNTRYNYLYFNDLPETEKRYWLHNILLGGGYFQQMGKKAKTYVVLLWNVNKTDDNPYKYPQFRIGFTIAF
ncbi:MAG: hypothetical protein R6V23_06890 [Bacteroidales bacterium]